MTLDIGRIQALCFDLDGTLRDTDDQFVEKLAGWLSPFSFILPGQDPRGPSRRVVMKLESPATYLFAIPDRLGFDHHLTRFGEYLHNKGIGVSNHKPPIVEGVYEMLTRLHERYPMAIITNRSERITRDFLRAYGLLPLFDCIVSAHTCQCSKPHPCTIEHAARKMEVHPSNCLMIGDTIVDMKVGVAVNAQTVGVLCGFGEEDELVRNGADMILSSTAELGETLS